MSTRTTRMEQLLEAIRAAEAGPGLSARVSRILRQPGEPAPPRWIEIDGELLGAIVSRLDGVNSTCRHLGITPVTLRRWAKLGMIKPWALDRMRAVLVAGAPSLRRKRLTVNYARNEGTDD